jgi:glutathione S-transferase
LLRLHTHPLSTYSRRVHMALIEKSIPFDAVVVDMAARKHRSPEYLAVNPYGRVPALEEDAFVLYESTAILNYLEATHPAPALVPGDARGRAWVDMHMKLCDLQMTRQTGTIIFPKRFLPKARWDEAAMAQARTEIQKHLETVERQLGASEYLVAGRFTLADLSYAPFLEFLPLMEIDPPPAVRAWRQRLLGRPSARQTSPAT